jgi:hypothetical protein
LLDLGHLAASLTVHVVVALTAGDVVAARTAPDGVRAAFAVDVVTGVATADVVVPCSRLHEILAAPSVDRIYLERAGDAVTLRPASSPGT